MTDATSSPPTVTSLTVYPVKSCGCVSLQSARVSATGLLFDRAWMVVLAPRTKKSPRARDGRKRSATPRAASMFVSQRTDPKLALVRATLPEEISREDWDGESLRDEAKMTLRAEGMASRLEISLLCEKPLRRVSVGVWEWVGVALVPRDAAAAWFSELLGKSVRLVRWLGDGSLPRAAIESARGVGGGGGGAVEARSVVHWFPYDPVRVVNADP
jgi:uncharacterized protein